MRIFLHSARVLFLFSSLEYFPPHSFSINSNSLLDVLNIAFIAKTVEKWLLLLWKLMTKPRIDLAGFSFSLFLVSMLLLFFLRLFDYFDCLMILSKRGEPILQTTTNWQRCFPFLLLLLLLFILVIQQMNNNTGNNAATSNNTNNNNKNNDSSCSSSNTEDYNEIEDRRRRIKNRSR